MAKYAVTHAHNNKSWGRGHRKQRGVSMDVESSEKISILVADAGPFIKGAPLQKWSNNVVTIREVLTEIRDKATRERLQVLPYELTFKEPSAEALQHGMLLPSPSHTRLYTFYCSLVQPSH